FDRADILLDLAAAFDRGLMIADVPLVSGDAGLVGESPRLLVIAGIVGDDRQSVGRQGLANGPADPARPAGDDCDATHDLPPSVALHCAGIIMTSSKR